MIDWVLDATQEMVLLDDYFRDKGLEAHILEPVSLAELELVLVKAEELDRLDLATEALLGQVIYREVTLHVFKLLVFCLLSA
jgi:hypothetical protein